MRLACGSLAGAGTRATGVKRSGTSADLNGVESSFAKRTSAGARRQLAVACGVLLLTSPPIARAEIYQWTDEAGRLHFSQDLGKVPAAERERAEADAKKPRDRDPLQVYNRASGREGSPAKNATSDPRAARAGRAMRIPFERHGTLMKVEVLLNGRVRAPFFIDTGASGVSIPFAVAQQLGLRIGPDTPQIQVRTANGVISEPILPLDSIQLGPARVDDVMTAISATMDIGLLGGAFFNNFVYQVDAAESIITLVPNVGVRGGESRETWLARFGEIREPLARLEAYLERGGFTDEGRVRELEARRDELRAALDQLESEANQKRVPRSWRQ